jgi:hypothetical protein
MDLSALFAEHGEVEELRFGIDFDVHMRERATYRKHEVAITEILEVHSGKPKYFENTVEDGAPIMMLGATDEGRWLCIPLDPTLEFGVWSPRTAFEANAHHIERYKESEDGKQE